ncbi:hypothetical protein HPB50_010804 [Hyalomma asiaticum]|uniref:Uncharacterized protein n=1 Tax=Hyalomma asiaticum TaxID=266040 RepID=A0ACB7SPG6_HYAAI|nr:hypothetical protein HPB50_010804 [Hyalomma asiaticum]
MAAETVITQSRKRVRLEQQSTSGPLVSLQAILSLANETQRCVNEGEATFSAGHVVCCGIKSSTDTEVSVESLCLQTSAIKGPPHCVNVTVRQDTGSVKGTCTCKAGLSGKCKHFFATVIYLNRTSKDSLDLLLCTDVQQQWGRTASSCLYEPRPVNTFCHVQRPTQKEFPEDIQKEILKELIDAAPESALAKHKTLSRLGLVVVPEVPWLGYSPDGVIIQGNKRILVEVKCPVLGQEQSIAELAITGPQLQCFDLWASWPGSAHDSRIFDNSRARVRYEEGTVPGILLGDKVTRGSPQRRYNKSQLRTHCSVERTFGAFFCQLAQECWMMSVQGRQKLLKHLALLQQQPL